MPATPYLEVNAVLQTLEAGARAILGGQLTGLYLYGSLALGDFDPKKSDIDFVIATQDEISADALLMLQEMHARLAALPTRLAQELEGSYIPLAALRRYQTACCHPHIDRGGRLEMERHDSDWIIQRFCLREFGETVSGPDIRTLIDPISSAELIGGVLDLMWWWELQLHDHSRVSQSGYQAYAILSMCRILYTFEHGTIVSKPEAARWALRNGSLKDLDPAWMGLIEQALNWQPGARMDRLDDTLDFIRYTLARSQELRL